MQEGHSIGRHPYAHTLTHTHTRARARSHKHRDKYIMTSSGHKLSSSRLRCHAQLSYLGYRDLGAHPLLVMPDIGRDKRTQPFLSVFGSQVWKYVLIIPVSWPLLDMYPNSCSSKILIWPGHHPSSRIRCRLTCTPAHDFQCGRALCLAGCSAGSRTLMRIVLWPAALLCTEVVDTERPAFGRVMPAHQD